jgi:hypothetical protein
MRVEAEGEMANIVEGEQLPMGKADATKPAREHEGIIRSRVSVMNHDHELDRTIAGGNLERIGESRGTRVRAQGTSCPPPTSYVLSSLVAKTE